MVTATDKLSQHEGSKSDLEARQEGLRAEQADLLRLKGELVGKAVLDKDSDSQQELQSVVSRLAEITGELEILGEARRTLSERMAQTTHEIAQDKRNANIEAVLSLSRKRAEILTQIEQQVEALAGLIGEAWAVNEQGLIISNAFPESSGTRSLFSQRHFSTALEYLLGSYLHRYDVSACLRPGNWQNWSWQLSTQAPSDLEQHLKGLPLK